MTFFFWLITVISVSQNAHYECGSMIFWRSRYETEYIEIINLDSKMRKKKVCTIEPLSNLALVTQIKDN